MRFTRMSYSAVSVLVLLVPSLCRATRPRPVYVCAGLTWHLSIPESKGPPCRIPHMELTLALEPVPQ
uniref:Putative secreted protein n=1 Tax=Anopheles darlingi TaxID=43151 RepID=A0A2M4DKN0_ANODA